MMKRQSRISNDELELVAPDQKQKINFNIKIDDVNIYFYDEVTSETILYLNSELKKLETKLLMESFKRDMPPARINLYVQSDGGDLLASFSTMDIIKSLKVPVHTYVHGLAASAATMITVVGARRFITQNSSVLIHQLRSDLYGTYENQKDMIESNAKFMKMMVDVYRKYTTLSTEMLSDILKRDIILNAKEALKYGIVDEIQK